eukprot:Protomagalhaensia_wolfi_Nauph_80__1942@NODE_221_length_3145_cov_1455_019961_g166_i0_p1_GENE_NODE_221_length_3145_cov_1455_019961_g166_i0NODE_221_length_3145_cov_1455_019961_g166_i0_p1_ORF_typecomplete_len440_score115_22Cys_Met_Meta_PP/PF01053_20/1_8e135SelA/PF03841_13/6_8e15Aminotran_1_2/PF00155_21/5_2e14Aminotran_1_2/PF00155_21/1_5e03Aminotran_5/PF00266_19/7_2e13Met_gamma_lyase/PF06838_11/8_6e11Beta_elim_lyase/PF01212_21/2e07DegT_DnrJ_EryC1/PF01041_17/0_00015OKR_DC_1/PF01276_20/0_11_NODE_221_le
MKGFGTRAIHSGHGAEDPHAPLVTPIYQTATYKFKSCEQGGNRFAGKEPGYIYTRLGNPTTSMLASRVAALEGAEAAMAFSSGIGAIASTVWTLCKAGDHIVSDTTLYGCTLAYLSHGVSKFGVEVTFTNLGDLDNLRKNLKENTVMVYLETPANPNMKIVDLEEVAKISHEHNKDIKVVTDNTFATPYLQNPLSLGCDLVIHSATKYLNGHGDVIVGFVCGSAKLIQDITLVGLKDMTGAVLGPFEAFLVLRGLKTLELRMQRHCDNAEAIVEFLKSHNKVTKVHFPGLPDHPNHEVAKRQMKRFGGMIALEVQGGRESAAALLDSLNLCTLAVSLGDAETLIEHPASMTHSTYSPEELEASGIPTGMIRLSTGLENAEDIIADLQQGFEKAYAVVLEKKPLATPVTPSARTDISEGETVAPSPVSVAPEITGFPTVA